MLVLNVNTCESIPNAIVDLWHCDALGVYSHFSAAGGPGTPPQNNNQTFLRGLNQLIYSHII